MSLALQVEPAAGYKLPLALDVSNTNPISLDQAAYARDKLGIRMLIAKATEGTSYQDPTFHGHRSIASQLDLAFGSYLFLHALSPGDEAAYYLDFANPWAHEVVIIDAEPGGQDDASINQMARRANSCAAELENAGRTPLLYASASYWLQLTGAVQALNQLRVWEAQYPQPPATVWDDTLLGERTKLGNGSHVSMWQFTDAYQVNGVGYDCSAMFDQPADMLQPKP